MNEEIEDKEAGKPDAPNLHDDLREICSTERQEDASKWSRALPFGKYIVNRWETAELPGFAEGAVSMKAQLFWEVDWTIDHSGRNGRTLYRVMVFNSRRGTDLYP